jgi:hypothetical protein
MESKFPCNFRIFSCAQIDYKELQERVGFDRSWQGKVDLRQIFRLFDAKNISGKYFRVSLEGVKRMDALKYSTAI